MGFLTPSPTILGVSIVAMVELICAVHLAACVIVLSLASSTEIYVIGGVEISPDVQCATAAWFLLGVPVIIVGGVGAVYRVEKHLLVYLIYLFGTLGGMIAWFVLFATFGKSCETHEPTNGLTIAEASFVCTVTSGIALFWNAVIVVAYVCAMFLVWSMREYIKQRAETELFRYQEQWGLAALIADEKAQEAAIAAEQQVKRTIPSRVPGGPAMPYASYGQQCYGPPPAYMSFDGSGHPASPAMAGPSPSSPSMAMMGPSSPLAGETVPKAVEKDIADYEVPAQ